MSASPGESPLFCSLKPVVLANDDYEDEITHLKQVACDEFRANNGSPYVNVSNHQSVNVTADNVEELFSNIVDDMNTQDSIFQGAQRNTEHEQTLSEQCNPLGADNLIQIARTLPKELYITEILKLTSSDRDRLENARIELFCCVQNTEGYPYDMRAPLKKRIQTRNGDSIEYKLAQDLYCLSLVLDGAEWEDLKEVITIPRPKKSSSQVPADTSFQAYNISDLENLKKTVHEALADIVLLKQENKILKTDMQSEIKSVRASIQRVNTEVESELKEIRSLISANALSVDRIVDEKSNGLACIKSGMKQIKSDVKSLKEEPVLSLNISQVEDCMAKFNNMEKKINRLDKRLQRDKSPVCVDLTKTDSNAQSGQVAPEYEPYQTVHLNKAASTVLLRSGETNLFSRMKITPQVDSNSTALITEPTSYTKRHSPSVCAEYSSETTRERPSSHDKQSSYEKQSETSSHMLPPASETRVNLSCDPDIESKGRGKNSRTYADVISAVNVQDAAPSKSSRHELYVPNAHSNFIPTRVNGTTTHSASSELRRVHRDANTQSNYIPTRNNGVDTDTANRVHTRESGSYRSEPDYSLLQDHVDIRRRSKRFYVGGFRPSITHEELIQYVESKGLTVTWAHIWPSKRLNRAVIRLNVEVSENCFRITEPGFWPRGVKCRPWLTNNTYKNTFLNPSRSKSYRGSDNDYHYDKYNNNRYIETDDDYYSENRHGYHSDT